MALLVGLALSDGGFEVGSRHVAGLAAWLVVVGLLVLGAGSRARVGWPLYATAGLFGCLALLSAISSAWSGSIELSVIEADRLLVYLAFFLAAFLIAQTDERRQRFAEGLAIAVTITVLLGLASRLLPHVIEVTHGLGSGPRLRYPLGYWNANGAMCGIATAMLLWLSRNARWTAMRWAAVAAMPAVMLTLYFTYSRGGVLALAVGVLCMAALSRDRLWMLATFGIAALGALPALIAVPQNRSLADNVASQASVDQGVTVLLILLAGTALSVGLYALLRRAEAREGAATRRALELSRDRGVLRAAAVALGVVAVVAAVTLGSRVWNDFSSSDIAFPNDPAQHFSDLSSAGRHDFWRVAIDAFGEKPLLGHGAGTYQFAWDRLRSIDLNVVDAHSLYLESVRRARPARRHSGPGAVRDGPLDRPLRLARELRPPPRGLRGAVHGDDRLLGRGGLRLVLGNRRARGGLLPRRGALAAARCAQASPEPQRPEGRRFGIVVGGVALGWLAAVALIGPLLVEREIDASQRAVADGDILNAVSHADTARSIEPWAASPYLQLGLIAEERGEYDLAIERLSQAIDREDGNWKLYALRARVEGAAGDSAAARADIARARELNPLAPQLQGVVE